MNASTKQTLGAVAAFVAVATIVTGSFAIAAEVSPHNNPTPEPTVSSVVYERPASSFADLFTPTPTPEPVIESPAPVVEEPAPVEEAEPPVAVEEEPTPVVVDESPAPVDTPDPIRCPGGSVSVGSDGVNDTACLPAECLSGTVGDPNAPRPQCEAAFRP